MPTIRKGKVSYNLAKMGTKQKVKVTKTVKVPKMRATQKAGVLAVVRRMLARNMENKLVGNQIEMNVNHNSPIGGADCRSVIPPIVAIDSASGNTSTQRMGDRIKPKSLTVKGVVSLSPDQLFATSDLYVRVIIASQKDIKLGSQVNGGSVDANRLLRPGFGGVGNDQVAFAGNTIEVGYPINKDKFRVYYDKVFKLGGRAGAGVEAIPRYSARISYKFKQLPSSLTFDEGNGDWANNFAPFLAIGYAYSDGTAPDTVGTRIISNVYSKLEFEDA